ncbi:MAG: hypothetical protein HF962_10145 [Sulfurovum sp.]|nr:hypothetical protein [Sulfurovum sp.]
MYENFQSIKKAKEYSEDTIKKLSNDFKSRLKIDSVKFTIVTTGSFARCEASEASDLDCFIIIDNFDKEDNNFNQNDEKINTKELLSKAMNEIVSRYIKKDAGSTGTFGIDAVVKIDDLLTNMGGQNDDNIQFSRRMLFLLEGKSLFNDALFQTFRRNLIEKYIKETVSDHQLSRFFLNDIIRFYRMMATDFEYKVSEDGKSWGVRNIKLTFSRKLLYFGGVLTVAETAQKTRETKIKETLLLLDMSPLERINHLAVSGSEKVFKSYDYFLEKLSDSDIRKELDKAKVEQMPIDNPEIFREMKNESKHFSWALSSVLKNTYDDTHPIHHALIF